MTDEGWQRDLSERLARVEARVEEMPARLRELNESESRALRQLISFNQERVAQLQSNEAKLTSMVDSLHRRMDQADHVTGDLTEQQPSLAGRVDGLAGEVQSIKDQLRSGKAFLMGVAAASGLAGGGVVAAVSQFVGS